MIEALAAAIFSNSSLLYLARWKWLRNLLYQDERITGKYAILRMIQHIEGKLDRLLR